MVSEERHGGLGLLVVEESVLLRRMLTDTLSTWPEVRQVITTATANIALSRLAQNPVDAVLVDLVGEAEEGFKALKLIREQYPHLPLVALGELDAASARSAVKALQAGVLEIVPRPAERGDHASLNQFRSVLGGLLMGFKLRRVTHRSRGVTAAGQEAHQERTAAPQGPSVRPRSPRSAHPPSDIQVVAIGISTGGPNALRRLIPRLPPDLRAPVLVVQHMPPNFTRALAESLDRESRVTVREAQEGDVPQPGEVYIAPGGRHLVTRLNRLESGERAVLGLSDGPPVNSCRPSVDVLFKSLAPVYGSKVLMVVMTGMGNDGLAGVAELKAIGGYCLTQSEESCVVYGMPRAVDEAGLSDESVALDHLATRLHELVNPESEKRGVL